MSSPHFVFSWLDYLSAWVSVDRVGCELASFVFSGLASVTEWALSSPHIVISWLDLLTVWASFARVGCELASFVFSWLDSLTEWALSSPHLWIVRFHDVRLHRVCQLRDSEPLVAQRLRAQWLRTARESRTHAFMNRYWLSGRTSAGCLRVWRHPTVPCFCTAAPSSMVPNPTRIVHLCAHEQEQACSSLH